MDHCVRLPIKWTRYRSVSPRRGLGLERPQIKVHHHAHKFPKTGARLPSELRARLGVIRHDMLYFRRPHQLCIAADEFFPIQADVFESFVQEIAEGVGVTRAN